MNFKKEILENLDFYFKKLDINDINEFTELINNNIKNNIFIIGIGKSENIGLHFSDLLKCISFKSIILNPSKILHGDIGIITKNDLVIVISNSGNTVELIDITNIINSNKTKNIILLSSKNNGKIMKNVLKTFIIPVNKELDSCFNLIPTNSYLNFLVFFNQIISELIKINKFTNKIYKNNHQKGNISLLLKPVSYFMRKKNECSILQETSTIKELIISMNKYKMGCSIIYNKNNKVSGLITDKDLRLYFENNNSLEVKIFNIMNKNFFKLDYKTLLKDINSDFDIIPIFSNDIFLGIFLNKNLR